MYVIPEVEEAMSALLVTSEPVLVFMLASSKNESSVTPLMVVRRVLMLFKTVIRVPPGTASTNWYDGASAGVETTSLGVSDRLTFV